jgi:hypothetical protein
MNQTKNTALVATLVAFAAAPGLALAGGGGGIDASDAVTAIGGITAAVGAVGVAKFAPAAAAVAYKWIKATIFG